MISNSATKSLKLWASSKGLSKLIEVEEENCRKLVKKLKRKQGDEMKWRSGRNRNSDSRFSLTVISLLSFYLLLPDLSTTQAEDLVRSAEAQSIRPDWSRQSVSRALIRRHHNIYTDFDSASYRAASDESKSFDGLEDQTPNELIFSNQTGAIVHCKVALDLVRSIERAERKLADQQAGSQTNSQASQFSLPSAVRNFNQQQHQQQAQSGTQTNFIDIRIRWEKENGEPIESTLYTSSDNSDSTLDPSSQSSERGQATTQTNGRQILRQVRPSDGSLVFEPFKAQDFRSEVHASTYRCIAWSESRGASLVSGDTQVRAILTGPQPAAIQPEVHDELVIEGNNALFKCQLPFHARDQFQVLDWIEYPSELVHSFHSTTQANANQLFRPSTATNSDPGLSSQQHLQRRHETLESTSKTNGQTSPTVDSSTPLGRYFVGQKSGDLHILNVDSTFNYRSFKCRAKNKLTGDIIVSSNKGKLIVTESHSSVSPRLLLDSQPAPVYLEGQLALLACNQQAFPRAQVTWSKKVVDFSAGVATEVLKPVDVDDPKTSGFAQVSSLLLINRVHRNHSGSYVCQAKNTAGEERLELELLVREPLRAKLSVSASVLELGKSLALDCTVSGYPIQRIVFKHNQNVIKSISGSLSSSTSLSHYRGTPIGPQSMISRSRFYASASTRLLSASGEPSGYFVVDDTSNPNGGKREQPVGFDGDSIRAAESTSNSHDEPESGNLLGLHHRQDQTSFAPGTSSNLSHVIVIVLEPQHTGSYQCFAYNQYESVQSSAYIRVLDDPPKFKDTFRSQVIEKHQDISLQCSARANPLPEITWSVDEQPIPESSRIRFGDFVTKDKLVISYVNISQAEVFDTGQYKCIADNGLAHAVHEAQISVSGPLQVKPMSNITVLASTSFRVRCPVAGYPIVDIQWHHNGRRLPANHRQRVFENGTLEVEHMERSQNDHGLYTCLASSVPVQQSSQSSSQVGGVQSAGSGFDLASTQSSLAATSSALGSIYVSIKAKPTIEPFSISRSLREGQRASIMCTISSGDLPIQIIWFLNDQPLQYESSSQADSTAGELMMNSQRQVNSNQQAQGTFLPGVRVNRVSDYSSTLLFESLVVQHSGNYTCLARNDAGSSSHQATMIVQVAPKWNLEPVDSSVVRGASTAINCMASGFPLPRIIWSKAAEASQTPMRSGSQEANSANSKTQQQRGSWRSIVSSPHLQVYENGSLNILDARDSDQGFYMCQATNGVGPGLSKVIKVTVNVAAQFNSRNSVQFVVRGDQTQLKCQVRGDWPIAVHWFRGKNRLEAVSVQEQANGQAGSVLMIPGTSSPSTWSLTQLRTAVANRPIGSSLIDQLGALILTTLQEPGDSSQNLKGSRGVVLPRYTLAASEQLNSIADSFASTIQPLEAASKVPSRHPSMGLGDSPNRVVQFNSILTISQADRSDTNTYKCIAANHFGIDERTIQLIVQDTPDRVDELSVVEVKSRNIVLGWLAPHDGNSPITNYQILYRQATISNEQPPTLSQIQPSVLDEQSWFNYTLPVSSNPPNQSYLNASFGVQLGSPSHQNPSIHTISQSTSQASVGLGNGRTIFKISINSLRPLSQYWFRVGAENKLGHGPLSRIIEASTQEEAPGAAPNKLKAVAQSSSTILVSWSRINEKELFGSIHGYYVAYKPMLSSDLIGDPNQTSRALEVGVNDQASGSASIIYKTIQHDDKLTKFDALLTGLKRSTKYMIFVSAFNARGIGPRSEPITVRTLEMDPPKQVRLLVKHATNCSIEIEWRPLSSAAVEILGQQQQQLSSKSLAKFDASQLAGSINSGERAGSTPTRTEPADMDNQQSDSVDFYNLFQADFSDRPRWVESRIPGSASSHLIENLRCGTRYQFYMIGVNRIGRGEQSDILDTKTAGNLPRAPDRQLAFDVINTTCYILRLDHWNDSGCPMRQFTVRYRDDSNTRNEWVQVAQVNLNQESTSDNLDHQHSSNDSQIRSKRWDDQLDESGDDSSYFMDYPTLVAADAAAAGLDGIMLSDYPRSNSQESTADLDQMEDTNVPNSNLSPYQQQDPMFSSLKESALPAFEDPEDGLYPPSATEGESRGQSRVQSTKIDPTNKLKSQASQGPELQQIRLCNLNPNVHYVVQVFAANGVGESDAELHLLTSPEGLEYDQEVKRQIVGKLGSGGRLAQLSFSGNHHLDSLLGLNQWPILVPMLLAILLISTMIIVSILLRRAQMGAPYASSSSNSTKSLTSDQHRRNFINGEPHDLSHYHLHQTNQFEPAPSSSISEAAATIGASGCAGSELGDLTNGKNALTNGGGYTLIRAPPQSNNSNDLYRRSSNQPTDNIFRDDHAYGVVNYAVRQSPQIGLMSTLPHNHHLASGLHQMTSTSNPPPNHHHNPNATGPIFVPSDLQHSHMAATLPHNSSVRGRNVFLCSAGSEVSEVDHGSEALKPNETTFYGLLNDQHQQAIYNHNQALCNLPTADGMIDQSANQAKNDEAKSYTVPNTLFHSGPQALEIDPSDTAISLLGTSSTSGTNDTSSSQSGLLTKQQYDNCFMSIVEEVARANDSLSSQLEQSRNQQQVATSKPSMMEATRCNQPECTNLRQFSIQTNQPNSPSCNYASVGAINMANQQQPNGQIDKVDEQQVELRNKKGNSNFNRLMFDSVYATIKHQFLQSDNNNNGYNIR